MPAMNRALSTFLVLLATTACQSTKTYELTAVTYGISSGSLPPAAQWSKEYRFEPARVTLSTQGGPDSGVATKKTEVPHSADELERMFRVLSKVSPNTLGPRPTVLPPGSAPATYEIHYKEHPVLRVVMTTGEKSRQENVTGPVDALVGTLAYEFRP
jgi:hypothetical protein